MKCLDIPCTIENICPASYAECGVLFHGAIEFNLFTANVKDFCLLPFIHNDICTRFIGHRNGTCQQWAFTPSLKFIQKRFPQPVYIPGAKGHDHIAGFGEVFKTA